MPKQPIESAADETLLSALTDGELTATEFEEACALWRRSSAARTTWHQYQLIGDVLRSDDLAQSSVRDADLFARIQAELARQPVVLAPAVDLGQTADGLSRPEARYASRRNAVWAWMAPSAAAAGVVLVATAWTMMQPPTDEVAGLAIAADPSASMVPVASGGTLAVVEAPAAILASGVVVRDAQLDGYLAAHKQFSSTSLLGVPSGSLRQVATEASGR